MSSAESKQVVLQFIADLSAGNMDGIRSGLADDATWWLPGNLPVSGTFKGKQAIFEGFFAKAFPFFTPGTMNIEVQSAIAEGDAVAVEWVATAVTAKGQPYKNYYHVRFDVRDGKIQTVREYVDSLYARDVLFA